MEVVGVKDMEKVSGFFRGEGGNRLARFMMRLFSIDKVNGVYDRFGSFSGKEFTSRLLDDIGVSYLVGNAGRLKSLPKGAFIAIANHPYGGLDGIMLIDLLARIRPDFRLMVNKLLSAIKSLNNNFISVNPRLEKKESMTTASIRGIKETIQSIRNGHPVGFFPSGAVSDFSLHDMCIRDRAWQPGIIHLIQSVKAPVLPVRFFDTNSRFFYFLGLISWKLRSLRLPSEVFNKKGQNQRIGIGEIISVEEQQEYRDPEAFGAFIRNAVYGMPQPSCFIPPYKL